MGFPVKVEGLLGDVRQARDFPVGELGVVPGFLIQRRVVLKQINRIGDRFQRIIDFVSNDSGEASHRGQSLGFDQSVFRLFAVGNIRVRTEPARDLAHGIANGQSTGKKPAIAAIFATQGESVFPGFTR